MYSPPRTDHPSDSGGDNAGNIDPAKFTDCLAAAHGLLDVFLSLDMSLIRALPTLYFVRLTYAAIVLIKLHFAAERLPNPADAAQKTLSLRVDDYLGRMLQKFSGWGALWPAWKLTKSLREIRRLFRQNSNREMMASELGWLNLWVFEEPPVNKIVAPVEQTIGGGCTGDTQSLGNIRQEALEALSLNTAEGPAPAPPILLRPDDPMLYDLHDTLPSMDLGDTSPWDITQLDKWLETNVNTSTFDFDGDLQSTIQYMNC